VQPLTRGAVQQGNLDAQQVAGFYLLDAKDAVWLETRLQNVSGFVDGAQIKTYAPEGAGVLGRSISARQTNPRPVEGPTRYFYDGKGPQLLVQVESIAPLTDDARATFELISEDVPYLDLGLLDPTAPVTKADLAIADGEPVRLLARGKEGQILSFEASTRSGVIPIIIRFTADDQIAAYALPTPNQPTRFEGILSYDSPEVALIEIWPGEIGEGIVPEGTVSVTAAVAKQAPYIRSTRKTAFTSVCPDEKGKGEKLEMRDDGSLYGRWDEGLTAKPLDVAGRSLSLFGTELSQLTVSTNGWLTTLDAYTGDAARSLGSASWPAGAISPLWADLKDVTVCAEVGDDFATVEWRFALEELPGLGKLAQPLRTATQARLFADGSIELAYELPVLGQVLNGTLFDPRSNDARENNAYVLSAELDVTQGHNTARFQVPTVQVPEPEPEPEPEPDVAWCEQRPAVARCLNADGTCTSYHKASDSQLDILSNQCTGNGGQFAESSCPAGYGYCASESDAGNAHIWRSPVPTCDSTQVACEIATTELPEEPTPEEPTPEEPTPEEPTPEEPTDPASMICEHPPVIASCLLSTLCIELYEQSRVDAFAGSCKGTWALDTPCPSGYAACVSPTDKNTSRTYRANKDSCDAEGSTLCRAD
jgi:hypothetical protein